MSFLRMQESPSSATLGDSCIRDCVKTSISVIPAHAGIPNCAMEGDSRMRGNDRYVNISCFHTVSFVGMIEMKLLRQLQFN
ncbi:MAG: hypothetical protein NT007_15445 [Candidatus Kapabacteria bacterium]|nr:hypothetical protein [Candidatus Kapabacteria bacterium]